MTALKALALLLLLSLAGCARMSVQVDVFDRRGLAPEDALEATVGLAASQHAIAAAQDGYARRQVIIVKAIGDYYQKLVGALVIAPDDLPGLVSTVRTQVSTELARLAEDRDAASQRAQRARLQTGEARRREFRAAMDEFTGADLRWEQFYAQVLIELDDQAQSKAALAADLRLLEVRRNLAESGKLRLDLLTAGLGLFDDPYAAYLVNAPERYWQGVYNRAHGSGVFGNTDLAIKMEGPGMFTVKGVKQGTSKLTQASLQVLKQGVQMVGVAYGLPLAGLSSKPVAAVGELAGPAGELVEAATAPALTRSATVYLLDAVLAERGALAAADAGERRKALNRIAAQLPQQP
ncbi:MAG: hypothetical protein EPN60_05000 [Nevskiaceae bacterium]|nr:MAG: hypothetical protein EPN60_05000 [Nevskiaceae bacterium]